MQHNRHPDRSYLVVAKISTETNETAVYRAPKVQTEEQWPHGGVGVCIIHRTKPIATVADISKGNGQIHGGQQRINIVLWQNHASTRLIHIRRWYGAIQTTGSYTVRSPVDCFSSRCYIFRGNPKQKKRFSKNEISLSGPRPYFSVSIFFSLETDLWKLILL